MCAMCTRLFKTQNFDAIALNLDKNTKNVGT